MKILDLLPAYTDYLQHERKLAKATIWAYSSDLRALARAVDKDVASITRSDLRGFMRAMSKGGKSTATIRRTMHGFGTAWKWFYVEGHAPEVVTEYIDLPRKNQAVPKWMDESTLRRFLAASNHSSVEVRENLAWRMLAYTGMRPDELRNLKIEDVNLVDGVIVVRNTKSRRDRVLPLNESLYADLTTLIYKKQIGQFVFSGARVWKRQKFAEAFSRALERAGMAERGYTPYTLRHTFATLMAMNGTPLHVLKDLLGHRDLNTTAAYLHASPSNLKQAMSRFVLAKDGTK